MSKFALVTGGNSGIGFEVVRALARLGHVVYLGSRDTDRGRDAVSQLEGEGDIRLIRVDLQDPTTLQAAVDQIEAEAGRLDILVNNAGASYPGTALDAEADTIRESFEVNLHGPMHLTQLAMPLLRRSIAGRIVNVSSAAGTFAYMADSDPQRVPYAYAGAKAALNAATVMFAGALKADGIKVNAASPGLVNTRVSRFHGKRGPAEGARIIVELATLADDGPTGGFFGDAGPIAW
jgi:NAD(P)-dependent dehydrogenase (short-subunit alcohol dehydrogenase family)